MDDEGFKHIFNKLTFICHFKNLLNQILTNCIKNYVLFKHPY
jgi:hypothetical protein